MKLFTFILGIFLFVSGTVAGQIIVKNSTYKVNFSNTLHQPRYVSYFLYKGGGDCDRTPFRFKNDRPELECATDQDYAGTKYDKGHLANAEDFAFDCTKDEETFRYYNCLPQTTKLNRGIWKSKETEIRKWSQTEKLYIVCGGYFQGVTMNNVSVPSYCWKIVQSVKTKEVLFCGWFINTSTASLEEITVSELEKRLHSKIILLK